MEDVAEKQPISAYKVAESMFFELRFSVLLLQKNSSDELRLYTQRSFDLVALAFL